MVAKLICQTNDCYDNSYDHTNEFEDDDAEYAWFLESLPSMFQSEESRFLMSHYLWNGQDRVDMLASHLRLCDLLRRIEFIQTGHFPDDITLISLLRSNCIGENQVVDLVCTPEHDEMHYDLFLQCLSSMFRSFKQEFIINQYIWRGHTRLNTLIFHLRLYDLARRNYYTHFKEHPSEMTLNCIMRQTSRKAKLLQSLASLVKDGSFPQLKTFQALKPTLC